MELLLTMMRSFALLRMTTSKLEGREWILVNAASAVLLHSLCGRDLVYAALIVYWTMSNFKGIKIYDISFICSFKKLS